VIPPELDVEDSLRRTGRTFTTFSLTLAVVITAAVSSCSPRPPLQLIPEANPIQPGDEINVGFRATDTSIAVAVTNFGAEPVQLLWHKSSLVGADGQVMEIIHEGGRGVAAAMRVAGDDYSAIPANSTLHDRIYVRRTVQVDDDDEVDIDSWFPDDNSLAGRIIRLSLTFRRGAVEKTYDWQFLVLTGAM
jgi:hypothetical protein